MLNDYAVIANEPLDIKGTHYEPEDPVTLTADDCAPLLVLGKVRLTTSPSPKRKRGRPKKDDASAPSYQRRDLRAEE